jgi:replicative DNA helicase
MMKQIPTSSQKSYDVELINFNEAIANSLKLVSQRRSGEIVGVKSRWPKLNRNLGGSWQKGCQYVIGGQPGTGKTVFADLLIDDFTDIVLNGKKILVLFWNFEMSSQRQILRIISSKLDMTVNQMLSADTPITEDEFGRIEDTAKRLKGKNVLFIDVPAKPSQIKDVIASKTSEFPDFHIINILDHSLLAQREKGTDTPRDLVSDISKTFMYAKKKYNCTNIIFSQVTREVDKPERRKEYFIPRITDLVWCSEMEHDADTIILMANLYDKGITEFGGRKTDDMLVFNIAKNRDGKKGIVLMRHDLKYNTINEYEDSIISEDGKINLRV